MKFPVVHVRNCTCLTAGEGALPEHFVDSRCQKLQDTRDRETKAFTGHRAAIAGLECSNRRLKRHLTEKVQDAMELRDIVRSMPGGEDALRVWVEVKKARRAMTTSAVAVGLLQAEQPPPAISITDHTDDDQIPF